MTFDQVVEGENKRKNAIRKTVGIIEAVGAVVGLGLMGYGFAENDMTMFGIGILVGALCIKSSVIDLY